MEHLIELIKQRLATRSRTGIYSLVLINIYIILPVLVHIQNHKSRLILYEGLSMQCIQSADRTTDNVICPALIDKKK